MPKIVFITYSLNFINSIKYKQTSLGSFVCIRKKKTCKLPPCILEFEISIYNWERKQTLNVIRPPKKQATLQNKSLGMQIFIHQVCFDNICRLDFKDRKFSLLKCISQRNEI